jgi:hypothetical protein
MHGEHQRTGASLGLSCGWWDGAALRSAALPFADAREHQRTGASLGLSCGCGTGSWLRTGVRSACGTGFVAPHWLGQLALADRLGLGATVRVTPAPARLPPLDASRSGRMTSGASGAGRRWPRSPSDGRVPSLPHPKPARLARRASTPNRSSSGAGLLLRSPREAPKAQEKPSGASRAVDRRFRASGPAGRACPGPVPPFCRQSRRSSHGCRPPRARSEP